VGKGYFFWCGVPLFPSSLHLSSHTPMVCDPFVPFHAVFHRDSPYLHFQIVRPLLVVCSIQMPIVAFGFSILFAFTLLGLISFREHRWICVHYLLTSHMFVTCLYLWNELAAFLTCVCEELIILLKTHATSIKIQVLSTEKSCHILKRTMKLASTTVVIG